MKIMTFYSILLTLFLSCNFPEKKIFIKSVQSSSSSTRVDWYFYSLLYNFSASYIQLSKVGVNSTVFESFYISDFNLMGDTLKVQLYKNDYKIDSTQLLRSGFKITVDTAGAIWNQASSRLGRLKRKNVDFNKPNFEDSYCSHGECY